jgi:hypothetical protein
MLAVVVALALVPSPALAAICFSVSGFTTVMLTGFPGPEGFFPLVGEAVNTCRLPGGGPSGQTAPLNGVAHGRGDGSAHFAIFVGGTASCAPISIQGTLDPPFFGSGGGTVDNLGIGGSDAVAFAPASCFGLD